MKKYLACTGIILLLLSTTACNKIKDAIFPSIDIALPALQFTVPAIPIVLNNEVSLGSFSMPFNLDSLVRANTAGAFGANAVSTVKVKKMVITITNGDANNNLSNFKDARFSFSSNNQPNAVDIATIAFADTPANSMVVEPETSPELKPYLAGSQLNYNLYGTARRTTSKALNFNVQVTLAAK